MVAASITDLLLVLYNLMQKYFTLYIGFIISKQN